MRQCLKFLYLLGIAMTYLALVACNSAELSKFTETDSIRLFNKIVAARNAVWATPLKTETDLLGAKSRLLDLKDSNGASLDPDLQKLSNKLILLSDRKIEIAIRRQSLSKDIEDFNSSGMIEKFLSSTRVDNKVSEVKRLDEELKDLSNSFDLWDIEFKIARDRLDRKSND